MPARRAASSTLWSSAQSKAISLPAMAMRWLMDLSSPGSSAKLPCFPLRCELRTERLGGRPSPITGEWCAAARLDRRCRAPRCPSRCRGPRWTAAPPRRWTARWPLRRQQLDGNVALVVQHRDVECVPALRQQQVGALRAVDLKALGAQRRGPPARRSASSSGPKSPPSEACGLMPKTPMDGRGTPSNAQARDPARAASATSLGVSRPSAVRTLSCSVACTMRSPPPTSIRNTLSSGASQTRATSEG